MMIDKKTVKRIAAITYLAMLGIAFIGCTVGAIMFNR